MNNSQNMSRTSKHEFNKSTRRTGQNANDKRITTNRLLTIVQLVAGMVAAAGGVVGAIVAWPTLISVFDGGPSLNVQHKFEILRAFECVTGPNLSVQTKDGTVGIADNDCNPRCRAITETVLYTTLLICGYGMTDP
jgi:hypothetical protein